jgi:mono/diheme cytochrome c family protein
MGLTVQPRPRDFRAGVFKYRSTPPGFLPTDEDLTRIVREGIPDTAMPAFGALRQRDVKAVIDYVKTFSPGWRQDENHAAPMALPKPPAWFQDPKELFPRTEKGRLLFATSCAPCHGASGAGAGAMTNLVDSAGHPTPARDLRLPYLRSGRDRDAVYRVMATGIDGTAMPGFAESATVEQRWELVAFIEELRRDYQKSQ